VDKKENKEKKDKGKKAASILSLRISNSLSALHITIISRGGFSRTS